MLLIALAGRKRSGKNTVADIILGYEEGGLKVKQEAFANPLKDEVAALLVMHYNDVAGLERWMMGNLGDSWDDAFYPLLDCGEVDFESYPDVRRALDEDTLKDTYFRRLLQLYGTEFRREQDEDFWLLRAFMRIDKAREQGYDAYLVSDVRFPNEIGFVGANKGLLLKVDRPSLNNEDGHASERALDDIPDSEYDKVIVNDGTLFDLEAKTLAWWNSVKP